MEKSERKNRTVKLRQIEAGIWIFIVTVFAGFCVLFSINHNKIYETHKINMPDVDGLIVGSPVNLMGIPIGYVTQTKIVNDDDIIVRFKITSRDVHLQKGTLATVEFSGLGGSKSLELYPPDFDKKITTELLVNNNEFILVERPKRLRDAWTLLYQMYRKVTDIIYTVSYFGNEVSKLDEMPIRSGGNETMNFIRYADNWLDNSKNSMEKFRNILYKGRK